MTNHFERLGLPRRFSVDAAELERLYLARSREVHPDFHTLGTDAERADSLTATAAVNEAYIALKDPFRRAEYMLGLLGGPTAVAHKDMPQAFLMEMMEIREQIEETKSTGNTLEMERIERELTARFQTIIERVGGMLDQPLTDDLTSRLIVIRKELNAAKVLRSLLRDLNERD